MEASTRANLEAAAEGFPLTGENIVCFAKDWDDDPTSNTHVLRLLAHHGNRILWLNSVGLRRPSLQSSRDLRRIARRLSLFFQPPRLVLRNLFVLTPLVIPGTQARALRAINGRLLAAQVRRATRAIGMTTFQLWSFLAVPLEYVRNIPRSLLVYYCVDNWSRHADGRSSPLEVHDRDLSQHADVVFATSQQLFLAKQQHNTRTFLSPHGVDHAHFAKALDADCPSPPELTDISGPVLGFIGLVDARVDCALLELLAKRHPEWTLVIVGTVSTNVARLEILRNVRFLPRTPYQRLPEFCKRFAVGLIPYTINDHTAAINPIKLREYLAAGLPVVSTPLHEVSILRPLVTVANDGEQFVQAIEDAIATDSPARRRMRSDAMRPHSWDTRVRNIAITLRTIQQSRLSAYGRL